MRIAFESFSGVRKCGRRNLETLGLVSARQVRKVLTVGGMLLFGRDRAERFPDAWIQAARFERSKYGAPLAGNANLAGVRQKVVPI